MSARLVVRAHVCVCGCVCVCVCVWGREREAVKASSLQTSTASVLVRKEEKKQRAETSEGDTVGKEGAPSRAGIENATLRLDAEAVHLRKETQERREKGEESEPSSRSVCVCVCAYLVYTRAMPLPTLCRRRLFYQVAALSTRVASKTQIGADEEPPLSPSLKTPHHCFTRTMPQRRRV